MKFGVNWEYYEQLEKNGKNEKCKHIVGTSSIQCALKGNFFCLSETGKTNLRRSGEHLCDLDCDWGERWSAMRKGKEWGLL